MRKTIPAPIIAVVSDLVSEYETHATLDSLFMHAGAPGDPPPESKHAKAMAWLRRTNKELDVDLMEVLGLIIEGYMEEEPSSGFGQWFEEKQKKVERLIEHSREGKPYLCTRGKNCWSTFGSGHQS